MFTRRGLCLVLSAPSGAGKSSLARALLAADPGITLSVSATTRAPRPGEVDGVDYHFVSQAEFARMVAADEMLEHATVFGRAYGTPRAPVAAALAEGRDVLFDIDWQGFRQLRAALPDDVVGVFVMPPSLDVLRDRLRARGDAEAVVTARMAEAEAEASHWGEFDFLVVNDEFRRASEALAAILAASRLRVSRASSGPN